MKKSIYDEKIYLEGYSEAIQTFERKKEEYSLLYAIERYKYEEVLKEYNHFLLIVRDLLKLLKLNGSLENSIAVSYLIHNGFLTFDKKFKNEETEDEIHTRYGMSILRGYGCCRNFSDMNYDIMRLLDFYVKNLYCYQPKISLSKGSGIKPANHVISLIDYDGNKYGIDLFNGCALYHFKNPLILEQISINTNGIIRNKPYYEIITEGKSLDDIKRQLEEYREYSKRKIISPYEYQDLKGEVIMYLNSQKNVLDDFHSSTRELKESIVKKMVLKP